ncbi:hypothetical protein [Rhodococcoides trifolii]|uniref:hypothetical protein n=1 Tax=Rhodococcoides trifolii TaxID=908250 RepID=UPI00166A3730|nr:hypothetical protein [Rhodococcus trifolii]
MLLQSRHFRRRRAGSTRTPPSLAIVDGLARRGATLPGPPEFTARLVGDIARSFHARWTGNSEVGLRELIAFLERSLDG